MAADAPHAHIPEVIDELPLDREKPVSSQM